MSAISSTTSARSMSRMRAIIFLVPLLTLVGCDDPDKGLGVALVSKVQGRIYLPNKEYGEPTVPADEICKSVSVSVGYYYTVTETPAPEDSKFTPIIPQFKEVEIQDPVGGAYDASANACTYSLYALGIAHAHQAPGGATVMASYDVSGSTWSAESVVGVHGQAKVTLENGKIAAPNIQLEVQQRVR